MFEKRRVLFPFFVSEMGKYARKGVQVDPFANLRICPLVGFGPESVAHKLYAPLGEVDLIEIENRLRVKLPTDYRAFLSCWNGGELFFCDVVIFPKRVSTLPEPLSWPLDPKGIPDLVDESEAAEPRGDRLFFLVIARYGYGDRICFDLRENSLAPRLKHWDREKNEFVEEWPSFTDWLDEQIKSGREDSFDYDGNDLSG